MGGKGSGGRRPGAGRRPSGSVGEWPTGAAVVLPVSGPSQPVVVDGIARPEMSDEVALFWDALAPLAAERGTLLPTTAYEFRVMCELAVQQRRALANIESGYGAYATLTKLLEGKLRAFKLAPTGRETGAPAKEKPKSALDRLKEQRRGLHAVR